ncbi:MAG: hypothetical protein ACFFCZ_19540 [Promethearchaeota archaeon]
MPSEKNKSIIGSGIIEITRTFEGIKFIESTLPEDTEKTILSALMPIGSPNKEFMYVKHINGCSFYQFFNGSSSRSLIGVVVIKSADLTQSILFHPAVKEINERIEAKEQNELLTRPDLSRLANLANLEGLLYAFFTGKPIVFIGDEQPVREILIDLNSLSPSFIGNHSSFISNTTQNIDSIDIQGINPSIVQTFDISDSQTIVNLLENRVYSLYDCDITINFSKLIKQNKTDELKGEMNNLFEKFQKIKDQFDPLEIAEILHCSTADAEFFASINQTIKNNGGQDHA